MVKDWAPLEDDVRQIYHVENKPLSQVMLLMRERHNFIASERSYRTQLRKWGLAKYTTQACPKPSYMMSSTTLMPKPASVLSTNGSPSVMDNLNDAILSRSTDQSVSDHTYVPSRSLLIDDGGSPFIMSLDSPASWEPGGLNFPLQDSQGTSQLHQAVHTKSLEKVAALLSVGYSTNTKDHLGNLPLHYGVLTANLSIVRELLQAGADVNAKGQLGRCPLHMANKPVMVDVLLAAGADQNRKDDLGNTPLHFHLSSPPPEEDDADYIAVTEKLLYTKCDLNLTNHSGNTPFHLLLRLPYYSGSGEEWDQHPTWVLPTIMRFLNYGADPRILMYDARSPLQAFLAKVHLDRAFSARSLLGDDHTEYVILCRFLGKGASPMIVLSNGICFVSLYFRNYFNNGQDNMTIARLLIQSVSPMARFTDGCTVLHELCANALAQEVYSPELTEMVRTVLQRDADPNCHNYTRSTPLSLLFHSAGQNLVQARAVTKTLLAHGAHPWSRDLQESCAIFQAIRKFGESGKDLVNTMLAADLRQLGQRTHSISYHLDSHHRLWPEWTSALEADSWSEAKDIIITTDNSLPEDITTVLPQCAMSVLAEKHLDLAKGSLLLPGERLRYRRQLASVLNECHLFGSKIDMKYYHDLVEMCLGF